MGDTTDQLRALGLVVTRLAADEIESLRQRVKELEIDSSVGVTVINKLKAELAALKSQQAAHMPVKTYCGGKPNYCKEQE